MDSPTPMLPVVYLAVLWHTKVWRWHYRHSDIWEGGRKEPPQPEPFQRQVRCTTAGNVKKKMLIWAFGSEHCLYCWLSIVNVTFKSHVTKRKQRNILCILCPCALGAINYSLRRQDVSLEPWRVSREADAKLLVCKCDTLQPAGGTPQIVGCCSLTWGIHQISLSSRRWGRCMTRTLYPIVAGV